MGAQGAPEVKAMEASVVPDEVVPDRASQTVKQLFRFSTWLHVGPGAEECEDVGEDRNDCSNPLHFHAWCRLPNQFQHREIREKAMAARARTARRLRDPESDAYAILEAEVADVVRLGEEETRKAIVEELVAKEWWRDLLDAQRDVKETELEDGSKPFETVEQDQRRLDELERMPESERPGDELDELVRHLARHAEALRSRVEEVTKPRREALERQSTDELLEAMRADRIDAEAQGEFMHVYNVWEWFVGALRTPRGDRSFGSVEHMQAAAPEVIEALQETFTELEQAQQGNS